MPKHLKSTKPHTQLDTDLNALHDLYVEAVNMAVAADDMQLVERLAAEYDAEADRLAHAA